MLNGCTTGWSEGLSKPNSGARVGRAVADIGSLLCQRFAAGRSEGANDASQPVSSPLVGNLHCDAQLADH